MSYNSCSIKMLDMPRKNLLKTVSINTYSFCQINSRERSKPKEQKYLQSAISRAHRLHYLFLHGHPVMDGLCDRFLAACFEPFYQPYEYLGSAEILTMGHSGTLEL
jgi:hypothetical protein